MTTYRDLLSWCNIAISIINMSCSTTISTTISYGCSLSVFILLLSDDLLHGQGPRSISSISRVISVISISCC